METMTDTRPTFSRITEGTTRRSWRAAVSVVVVIVAVIAVVGYLASSISSSSQRASVAERDANQYREQLTTMTKQVGDLQKDVALARSPGRTTVILEPAAPAAKGKKAAAPEAPRPWAAITWGELPSGKSWMRVNAYGLGQNLEGGKAYHVWLQPASGEPVDVGSIDIDQNGSGSALKMDLPAVDQGKAVMLTIDSSDSKQSGELIARADLPKLTPTMTPEPTQQAQEQGQPGADKQPAQGQAKTGTETQQMHKSGK
jgi:hypothetical protein